MVVGNNHTTADGRSVHAEEDALNRYARGRRARRGRCKRRDRVDVYVARVDAWGKPKMARPCAACAERLRACPFLNIRYVYFTTEEGWERVRLRDLDGCVVSRGDR